MKKNVACKGCSYCQRTPGILADRTKIQDEYEKLENGSKKKKKRLKCNFQCKMLLMGRKSELHMDKQEHRGKAEALQVGVWGANASQTDCEVFFLAIGLGQVSL